MGLSRQEVNLRRLLARCELMCKSKKDDEHLEKYLESLEDMFYEIKKQTHSSSSESLKNYQKRIQAIKTTLGITTNKYEDLYDHEMMRNDLLGVKQRMVSKPGTAEDMDEMIKYHEDMQKKITDEMLTFTKSLKEQSQLANRIIKNDTEVVSNSTQLTDQNFSKLALESTKLAEHSKRAWKCWMWLMLAIVLAVFINMVLFMKVVKKN